MKKGGGQDKRDSGEASDIPQACITSVWVCFILDNCTTQRSILTVALGLHSDKTEHTGMVLHSLACRIDYRLLDLSSLAVLACDQNTSANSLKGEVTYLGHSFRV